MATYISPGVYIEEKDVSTFVQNASPIRPGIALRAPWGPFNEIIEITSQRDLFDIFGVPANGNYVGFFGAKQYLRVGNNIKVVRVKSASDVKADQTFDDSSSDASLVIEALYEGDGGNNVSVKISTEGSAKRIDVYFYGELKETYTGLEKSTETDKNLNYKTAINGVSDFIVIATDATADANTNEPDDIAATALTGGSDNLPTKAELIGASDAEALQLFLADTVYVNVLICPDGAKLVSDSDVADVGKELITICGTQRKDAVGIVDIPAGKSAAEAINFKEVTAAYNSSYGAVFWSWVTIYEATIDADISFPASVAGLIAFAQSDALAYAWFAAAGYNRAVINFAKDVEYNPGRATRDLLTDAQINPIVNEPGAGIVILGNKTTQVATTALQSLNIRRMLLTAEKLVEDVAKQLIMEPNDTITEEQFISLANSVLGNIAAKRGINEFYVASVTTTSDRENNQLKFHLKIKPTKTAEVIVATFEIVNQEVSFED
jgi:phage tail sheath protein FI